MKKIILFGFILSVLAACNSTTKSDKNEADSITKDAEIAVDLHNARNSLDYYGIYEGLTPCADCEGIKVTVTLNKDESFTIKDVYIKNGKEVGPTEQTGKYTWDDEGSIITLNNVKDVPTRFFVSEGYITIVDANGNDINPEMIENYRLKQTETF